MSKTRNLSKLLGASGQLEIVAADQVSTTNDLPTSGNTAGEQRFVTGNNRLYMWNGSGWYNIALVNTSPTWDVGGQPAASYSLDADSPQSSTTITLAASDPEGIPINYTYVTGGSMDSMSTITQDSSVFTIQPKTLAQMGDATGPHTGTITFRASDGVNILPQVSTFTLTFITTTPNSASTQTLMKATGTGNNTTFLDGSTNNHTITRVGDTEQHAFSPFRDGGYSVEFDGNGDYLLTGTDTSLVIGSNDFTAECWIYPTSFAAVQGVIDRRRSGDASNYDWTTYLNTDNTLNFYASGGTRITSSPLSTNKWYHTAVVKNSGTTTLYVDGVSQGTWGDSATYPSNQMTFGAYGPSLSSLWYSGFISDIRIVIGTAVYTSNFDPPTERLTFITNTKLLIGGNSFRDNKPATTASQKSLYFGTNSNNYLLNYGDQAALEFGTNSWTIEAWIYSAGTMSNAGIFSRGANGSFWHSLHMASANSIKYVLSNGAGQEWSYTSGGSTIPSNTWVHVALVRRFGTDIKLYVNGTAIKTDTANASTTLGDSTADFKIGFERFQGSGGGFNGYISNFRFVNGTAVYTGDFTPPTSPLTNVANTVILHHGLTNEVTGGVGNPSNTSVTVNSLSPFNTVHTVTPNGDTKIRAFSPFNETGAYDAATEGGSALFDGNGDSLSIPSFVIGTSDYTIEMWFHPTSLGNYVHLYDGRGGSSGDAILIQLTNTGTVRFYSVSFRISGSDTVSANTWNHVALERVGNVNTLYLNGVSQGTYNDGGTSYVGPSNGVGRIGSDDSGSGSFFPGHISNFRIVIGSAVYNGNFTVPSSPLTAVTNTQLLLNMTNANIFDASQYQQLMSFGGNNVAASSAQQHFGENTIYFDGTGDYIVMKNPLSGTEDFTMEGWIYQTASGTYDGYFSTCEASGADGGIVVAKDKFFVTHGGGSTQIGFSTIENNAWYHIALQRNSNVFSLYLNGALVSTVSPTVSLTGDYLRLASRYIDNATYALTGHIHDFRISKGLARYPYIAEPVTLTTTNSGMTKPDGSTITVTGSNTKFLACHASTIVDGSANGATITVNGNAAVSDFGPAFGMKSVSFDGTGDYLQATLPTTISNDNWTIEYWVYHNNLSGNQIHVAFNGYDPALYYRSGSSAFAFYQSGAGIGPNYVTHVAPVAGRWYHIAMAHDTSANTLNIFVDGAFHVSQSYTGSISGTTIRVGDDGTSAFMNGYISNLRVVHGETAYTNSFTAPTTAFLA